MLSSRVPPTKKAQESIQRTLWILWRIWTQSSRLSQQEKQPKYGPEIENSAKEKTTWQKGLQRQRTFRYVQN